MCGLKMGNFHGAFELFSNVCSDIHMHKLQ